MLLKLSRGFINSTGDIPAGYIQSGSVTRILTVLCGLVAMVTHSYYVKKSTY